MLVELVDVGWTRNYETTDSKMTTRDCLLQPVTFSIRALLYILTSKAGSSLGMRSLVLRA